MRALLVLHGVLGAVVVGLLTHHAVWSLRGRFDQSTRYARYAFIAVFAQLSIGVWVATRFAPRTPLFHFKVAAAVAAGILTLCSFLVHRLASPGPLHRGMATLAAACGWLVGLCGLALLGR